MSDEIRITKFAFLLGAVLDGFWAVALAFPSLYIVVTGNSIVMTTPVRVVFIIAASLMFGWTFLLIWGYLKPVERRFILLLTAFPAVFGIFIGTLLGFFEKSFPAIIFVFNLKKGNV